MPKTCDMKMFRDLVHLSVKYLFKKDEVTRPEGCEDHAIAVGSIPDTLDLNCVRVYVDCYNHEQGSFYRKPDLYLHLFDFREAAVTDAGVLHGEKMADWFSRKFKEWNAVPWSRLVPYPPRNIEVS